MFIKVCGMRSPSEVAQLEENVDFLGFIYHPGSKRFVEFAPQSSRVKRVGVFVKAAEDVILATAQRDALDFIQLHGNEEHTFCQQIKKHTGVIKAFGVHEAFDFTKVEAYESAVDYFLFDTFCNSFGGSGRAFQWDLLNQYTGSTPFFLSGGLSPALLPDLLRFHHPLCVGLDLNSGFELAPGQKNTPSLLHFIENYHAQYTVSPAR